jgi:hypothetical protein
MKRRFEFEAVTSSYNFYCRAELVVAGGGMGDVGVVTTIDIIQAHVEERLKYVEREVDKLVRSRRAMQNYVRRLSSGSATPPAPHAEHSNTLAETPGNTGEISADLERILSLAKDVRSSGLSSRTAGNTGTRAASSTSTKVKDLKIGRQTLGQALSGVKEASTDAGPAVGAAAAVTCDIAQQLLFFGRYKIPPPLCVAAYSKDLYCEQAKFQSSIRFRPVHPDSVLYTSVTAILDCSTAVGEDSTAAHRRPPESIVLKLANSTAALVTEYERWTKGRVAQKEFKAYRLSAEDRTYIVTLWMRGRKLLELYEHLMKRKSGVRCACQHCVRKQSDGQGRRTAAEQVTTLHSEAPLTTPLASPSTVRATEEAQQAELLKTEVKGRKDKLKRSAPVSPAVSFAQSSLDQVDAYHRAYRSRVQCIVEASIGHDKLMATVQGLRVCCEQQTKASAATSAKADHQLLENWICALKQYRTLYGDLVCQSQNAGACMFVVK